MGYLKRVLLGLDRLGNTLLNGREDETISSRVGRAKLAGKRWAKIAAPVIDAVFGRDHCVSAIEWDEIEALMEGEPAAYAPEDLKRVGE